MNINANISNISIVGATGLVGKMFARVLTEEKIHANYTLFNRTGGATVEINGRQYKTIALTDENIAKTRCDFALFSAGADISLQFAPKFAQNGAVVIDNSSAWRRDPSIPLVIPEVNPDALATTRAAMSKKTGAVVANPNCTTIGALVALAPLDRAFKLKRVIYSTYQAISGAGANPKFDYPIDNNAIPYIGGEEEKMVFETRKILGHEDIGVSATCVRIPVANCHTISINAQFERPFTIMDVKRALIGAPGLVVLPDLTDAPRLPTALPPLPMPIVAEGHNEVFAGRFRIDDSAPNTINFLTASDNIRKGAATNAVQILKCLMS